MPTATATANGIEVAYEEFGDRAHPPLLLVMGLGAQMLSWDTDFCLQVADRGYRVIRFDNRDVGLSTKIEGGVQPDLGAAVVAAFAGQPVEASYLLADMANDAFGLLDHLGIDSAHVVGASMGGMIAQTMAITRPERVSSLTSIMSTTGDRTVGQPGQEAVQVLLRRPPSDRDGAIEQAIEVSRLLAGPHLPFDEARARRRATEQHDRCFYPVGVGRQLLAILASGDRTEALREVTVPTLVIHGDADPLVTYSGGEATAKAIPGAELLTIDGMGHSLPEQAWPQVIGAIDRLAGSVERAPQVS